MSLTPIEDWITARIDSLHGAQYAGLDCANASPDRGNNLVDVIVADVWTALMPAVGGSAGSYGPLIVTPDMVPPDATDWDAQEQVYRSGATTWDGIHQQIVRDNAAFRDAADSRGFDAAHEAGAMLAEEAKTISEWHDGVATKCADIASVLRETTAAQQQLVRDADATINAAKLPGEREALVGPTTRKPALRPAGASKQRWRCTHRSRPAPKTPAL